MKNNMNINKNHTIWFADFLCLVVAVIWGIGFIASQAAIDANMSASFIMMSRFSIAAVIMFVVCLPKLKQIDMSVMKAGTIPGILLFGGFYTQILGQQRTTVSHCAFLTATNVVMVPFLVWIFSRRRPPIRTFIITVFTLVGITVLSIEPNSFELSFNLGDALSLLCALFFAMHITVLGRMAKNADSMLINFIQLATAALISMVVFLLTDVNAFSQADLSSGIWAILFLGLFSTSLCFFLQTYAQKYTTSVQAGVLLSTEGLFGSVFSVILGMEALTVNMIFGGAIILLSVVALEFFSGKSDKQNENSF